jgi:CO dehydrogenase maturation factor
MFSNMDGNLGIKIAVTGKGGVGKSTLAGMLAHLAKDGGKRVLAVDSDPDANLAFALGIPADERKKIIPIAQRTDLIEERTGAKLKQFGQIFKLNPDITDVADRFSYDANGIHLLVMGAIEAGGSGCACPENVFLRNLLSDIILHRDEFVVVDMEAGIEHLGRATAKSVDLMIIVVEPTSQSIATAKSIAALAREIGVGNIAFAGNKISAEEDKFYIASRLDGIKSLGYIPYSESIRKSDRESTSLIDHLDHSSLVAFRDIFDKIIESDS